MSKQALYAAFFLFITNPVAYAQQSLQALTWEEAVQQAKANNPDLVSARERLNQAKANKTITQSNALPQVTGSITEASSKSSGSKRTDSYAYGASVKQLLFDGHKTSNDIHAAAANIKADQYNYDVVSSNVRLNLRTAFVDLLNAQEALNVAKDIAGRRKQNLGLVTLQYQGGSEHKGSLLTAQANSAQAGFAIAQAQRDIGFSKRRLVKAMGWEQFVPVIAKEEFAVSAADRAEPVFENMIETIPFLQQLVAQKEAAKFGAKSAQAGFFPQIYASADIGKTGSGWPPGQSNLSAGLSLSLPLFEGGAQQAQLSKARAVLGQSQADERSGRDGVLLTLAQTWAQWQDGIDNVEVQRKFLEAAQVRGKIAEAQYKSGLITFNDWVIIEDSFVSAQKSFLSAETDALIGEAYWVQAKGETIDE